jgi:hypothetical protein
VILPHPVLEAYAAAAASLARGVKRRPYRWIEATCSWPRLRGASVRLSYTEGRPVAAEVRAPIQPPTGRPDVL